MKQFRLLKAEEIECRVSRVTQKGVVLLLYKTARTDADLLDETFTPFGWKNDFNLIDGVLYGGIGILHDGEWIWKWDAGTESNTEAEKGRASDAFKRAGFKWGLGRELYSAPFIFIAAGKCNIENGKCNDKFDVTGIDYEDDRISYLCIDLKDKTVFEWGEPKDAFKKPATEEEPPKEETPQEVLYCADCGRQIKSRKKKDGSIWKAADIAKYTNTIAGRVLCVECGKVELAKQEKTADGYKA